MANVREKLYWNQNKNFVVELVEISKSNVLVRSIFDLRRNTVKFNNGLILMEKADFDKLQFIDFNNEDNFLDLREIANIVSSGVNTMMNELREEIYVQH